MKEDTKLILWVIFCFVFVITLTQPLTSEYINRPFGMECRENSTVSYGDLKSCGDLVSEDTAKIGIWSIFIGLPLLTFVILPILNNKKKLTKKVSEETK